MIGNFNKDKKPKLSDKESDPSGIGFDDNYDDAFLWEIDFNHYSL